MTTRVKHGHKRRGATTPEYRTWCAMIERCERQAHIGFKYYGARGIKVCARWRKSFAAFLADMGRKPTPRHTIDRIRTNGNYKPNNCQWSTPRRQRLNQRPYDERARCLKGWETRRVNKWKPKRDRLGRYIGV